MGEKNDFESDNYCSNCKWLDDCAIRFDYELDTCEEHEKVES
jgi:hypothetical protein